MRGGKQKNILLAHPACIKLAYVDKGLKALKGKMLEEYLGECFEVIWWYHSHLHAAWYNTSSSIHKSTSNFRILKTTLSVKWSSLHIWLVEVEVLRIAYGSSGTIVVRALVGCIREGNDGWNLYRDNPRYCLENCGRGQDWYCPDEQLSLRQDVSSYSRKPFSLWKN